MAKVRSIALIGPDGAGKTTITRMLERSGLLPFRYLYMGVNISSSNAALPTSRLIARFKQSRRRKARAEGQVSAVSRPAATRSRGRAVRSAARLAYLLTEEWFRQVLSRYYQWRGFVLLYDRHFVFDFAPEISDDASLDKRVHRWVLSHIYPRPDLVVFLDAPGHVLFARKKESTVEELERRRQAFLRQGERLPGFVRVDATRPLEEVYAEVAAVVVGFARTQGSHKGERSQPAAPPDRASAGSE